LWMSCGHVAVVEPLGLDLARVALERDGDVVCGVPAHPVASEQPLERRTVTPLLSATRRRTLLSVSAASRRSARRAGSAGK
jgi:hypothetical protein